jgi:hypothetical protein
MFFHQSYILFQNEKPRKAYKTTEDKYLNINSGITLVHKDFVPRGKISVTDVFLDAEFKFHYHPHLSLQVKGLKSSVPGQ